MTRRLRVLLEDQYLVRSVGDLLGVFQGCSEGRTLVLENGRLVGIVSPSDISMLLRKSLSGRS